MAIQDADLGAIGPNTGLDELTARYGALDGTLLLRPLIEREFNHKLAVVPVPPLAADRVTGPTLAGAGAAAGHHGRD